MKKFFLPEEYRLSNGIPVVIQHLEGAVASIYWWVQVGSADERKNEEGFAHFLEHMLFKDTAAKETGIPSSGKTARAIESLGGEINAYTSFDQTVYHCTCAERHWEKVIESFSVIAKPLKFLKEDFNREKEVILEELRKNNDSPGRQMFESLLSATFVKHPYGRPVIGFEKTLKLARVKDLENFYHKHYSADKMGLILVGPVHDQNSFRKKNLLRILEKRFASKTLSKKASDKINRPIENELRSKSSWILKPFDVKALTLALAFRVPNLLHNDIATLDLLSGILSNGELSRLYQQLFYKSSYVTEVSGSLFVPKDPGVLYFEVELENMAKLKPAVETLFSELHKISLEPPTHEELERVIVNCESERLYSTQSTDGLASRLGFLKFVIGDINFDHRYLEQLRSVNTDQIVETAKKYFDYRRMSCVILYPQKETLVDLSEIKTLEEKFLSRTAVEKSKPTKKSARFCDLFETGLGIKVIHLYRPHSNVFSVHASVLGGLRAESEHESGISSILAMTWTKGTSHKSAKEISTLFEGRAASIDGFSGRNSLGLQLVGLAKDWEVLAPLFSEILLDPSFPESEIDHTKRITEDTILTLEDHSAQLCSKLFLETLYQKHPYGKMIYGSLDTIRLIDQKKLIEFHKKCVYPKQLVLSVSGDIKRTDLERWLEELEDVSKKIKFQNLQEKLTYIDEPPLGSPRWIERVMGREQLHILEGGLGVQMTDSDRFALRVLQTLLGGQSGRLFIELREKKSLAYNVAPVFFEGIEKGYLGVYAACAPNKREDVLNGVNKILEQISKKGPSNKELERAKEYYLGHRAMEFQGDGSLAAHFGLEVLYGLNPLDEEHLPKLIQAVSSNQIQDVCKKYYVDTNQVTAVVG